MIGLLLIILIILIILVILLFNLIRLQEKITAPSIHSDLVNSCFSKSEINSFNNNYKFSKIIYGKHKKVYVI